MVPLTVADLLPLEEYAARRREFFDAHRRYLDRYRRVRIGPRLTLIFENRQTLWYRVQEVVRIARLADRRAVEQELDLYNRLLPGKDLLQAALLIEIADETRLFAELVQWRDLAGDQLRLVAGTQRFPATLVTCRPEDRCAGTAHWVQFAIEPAYRLTLADVDAPAHFEFDNGIYQHRSAELSDDLRQSLLDDLELSDRDDQPLAA
ncbi:MAG: DUF3501 family protein [Gemmataceae bacterium]|nr:DUF3501 family protein [Gemmataceae bacterium]